MMTNDLMNTQSTKRFGRRAFVLGAGGAFAALALPGTAKAQGLTDLLARASDSALDKLAKPDAFYDDEDIRIKLPIVGSVGGGLLGGILGGSRGGLGLLGGVTRKINDAAGVAAGEAKPIFRESIGQLSLTDAPGIIRESDGGTQYLKSSAGDTLLGKLRPLVDTALGELGVYSEIDKLSERSRVVAQAGLTSDRVGSSVTDQALDGIFSYIGSEETNFRKSPLKNLGGLLGDVLR
ncbi:DUF4197 domain-containing protein [Erythrobacter sp. W53]|uniref:DUF4197 domain-containing protein n=1 Tax=Erythrobacter sp. W53 TaxID=3425947 RepID=UPI003D7674AE